LKQFRVKLSFMVLSVFYLTGCLAQTSSFVTANPLRQYDPDASLKPGITKRQEVIEALGPPLTLARQGGTIFTYPEGEMKQGGTETSAEVYFEIFRDRVKLKDSHIIYYYQSVVGSAGSMVFVAAGSTELRSYASKLWILMDDDTGTVIDHVFRPARKR